MIDPHQSTSPALPAQAACATCGAATCICDVTLGDGSDEADALAAGIPEAQDEPEIDGKRCPDCERPNQFGDQCESCRNEYEDMRRSLNAGDVIDLIRQDPNIHLTFRAGMSPVGRELFSLAGDLSRMQAGQL